MTEALDEHPDHGDLAAHEKLPHCKDPSHVHVTVLGAHPTVEITATHAPHLACQNTPYTGPGVIISHRAKHPLDGLHLLPEEVAVLPGQLRDGASHAIGAGPDHTVAITHTSLKVFIVFGAMTPGDAIALADAIEHAA